MKFCQKCGCKCEDTVKFCPDCGYEFVDLESLRKAANGRANVTSHAQLTSKKQKSLSALSILSLVFAILPFSFAIGLILAIIDMCISKKQKHWPTIAALVISSIYLVFAVNRIAESVNRVKERRNIEAQEVLLPSPSPSPSFEGKYLSNAVPVDREISILDNAGYIYVSESDLDVYREYLVGTHFYSVILINSGYGKYIDDEGYTRFELKENLDSEEWDFLEGKEALISGVINDNGSIVECQIINVNDSDVRSAKTYISNDIDSVDVAEKVLEDIEQSAAEFKNDCIDVSWEDLRRNPDVYKGEKIKISVKFVMVEADGMILQGTQVAKVDNNNDHLIAISDNRTVRSPRFMEGDAIVLYGYGNGLSKLVSAGVGGHLSDIWSGDNGEELPSINVQYTENDDYGNWLKAIKTDSVDYHIAR